MGYGSPGITYTLAVAAGTAATATTRSTTSTGGLAATGTLAGALTVRTLSLLSLLRLAGELDRDLALEDLLAGELCDGALGLIGGGKVDEGVADGAVGSRVLRDGNGLTKRAWRSVKSVLR